MEFISQKSKPTPHPPPPTPQFPESPKPPMYSSEASFRRRQATPWSTLGTGVVGALVQLRTGSVSARSNTVCCWHSHKQVSEVPRVSLISVLMSPTIYWLISNLLPTNMQMSDKHRFSASVIIRLMYKPLSSLSGFLCVCVCVCSCIRAFIIFRSELCAFLCFNKREFSDYYILNIFISLLNSKFTCHFFFFARRVGS